MTYDQLSDAQKSEIDEYSLDGYQYNEYLSTFFHHNYIIIHKQLGMVVFGSDNRKREYTVLEAIKALVPYKEIERIETFFPPIN